MSMTPQEQSNRKLRRLKGRDDVSQAPAPTPFPIMDQSCVMSANRVVPVPTKAATRKRARENVSLPTMAQSHLPHMPNLSSSTMLPQLQANPVPSLHSTGLQLTPNVQNLVATLNLQGQHANQLSAPMQFPHANSGGVTSYANNQLPRDEINDLVRLKEQMFCRILEEKWKALFEAAEAESARNIREKDAALVQIASRCIGLQQELARTSAELAKWKNMAASEQSINTRLRALLADLLNAPAPPPESCGSGGGVLAAGDGAEDAESIQIGSEPEPRELTGSCVVCRRQRATIALLPCRCLSLCSDCQQRVGANSCPSCDSVVKARFMVVIS